jgi:membrane-associated protease RseP (regulator of RpoE activity)
MLLQAHSGFRYLVLLAGLVLVLYAAYGVVTKRQYDPRMRVLSAVFVGVLDLTVLLGFINLFTGMFYPMLGGHIVMMLLAAIVAHVVHAVMKRRPAEQKSYVPHLVGTGIVLAMVVAGIMAIGRPVVG